MAAYDTLRAAIDNYIKANGNKEITGAILNDILNAMVTALGADTRFAGVAVPSTNPGNPEGNVVYFASQAGTYSNFGGIVLPLGIHILVWNGTAWTSQTWFSVDNTPTQNSQNLATSGGILQAIVDAVGVERLRAIGVEVTSCSFDGTTKKISFFNSANTTLFQLDATAFVIDGMVSDVKIEDGNLVIQFNTDAGKQDIEIPLTDIFNPANYYTKTAIDELLALYYTKTETDALLTAINNKLADGCLYRGMAEPTTNPPTPTTKVFYIATKAGTYTNFGNIAVTEGITILKHDGSNWSKEQICYSDGVFDISAYNGTSYADLSAALGTNGANIPQNLRKGGMSVKFVQSSDNKYVQSRCMAQSFTTDVTQWQGVDEEPTAGSENLVESGGANIINEDLGVGDTVLSLTPITGSYISKGGSVLNSQNWCRTAPIAVSKGDIIVVRGNSPANNNLSVISLTDENQTFYKSVAGLDKYGVEAAFSYLAVEDGYVVVSFYTSGLHEIRKADVSSIKNILSIIPQKTLDDILSVSSKEGVSVSVGLSGKYLGTDGFLKNGGSYSISNEIHLKAGELLYINIELASGLPILGRKQNDSYYEVLLTSDGTTKDYKYIADRDCYIVLSYLTATPPTVIKVYAQTVLDIYLDLYNIRTALGTSFVALNPVWTGGYYYNQRGEKKTGALYRISDPIAVNIGDFVKCSLRAYAGAVSVAVYTTSDGTPLEPACVADYDGIKEYSFYADRTGYISFCYYYNDTVSNYKYSSIIKTNLIKEVLGKVEQGLEYRDSVTFLPKLLQNPIEKINEVAGMTSIIRSWGFIGDSLASGCMNYTQNGEYKIIDMYDYSWGQMLCRLTGATGYNFSYAGQYAKRWITALNEGGVTKIQPERCWEGAKENLKDAYIIALGENDMSMSDAYPEGAGDVSTDIGTYDSVNDTDTNNHNTYAGWMAGIIQRLQSVQPKAPIFLVTLPKRPAGATREAFNTVIRDLAEHFENVFLIDMYKYAPDLMDLKYRNVFFNSAHMNALGYQWIAYMFCTYIDWIIRNNMDKFNQQQFVGTDYEFIVIE